MTDDTAADFRLLLAGELKTLQQLAEHLTEPGLRIAMADLRNPATLEVAATATALEQLRIDLAEIVAQRLGELTGAGPEHFRDPADVVPDSPAALLDGPRSPEPPFPAPEGRPAEFDPETGTWRPE